MSNVVYTIEKNIEFGEDALMVSFAYEEEYKKGFTATDGLDEVVIDKIESIGYAINPCEIQEGIY